MSKLIALVCTVLIIISGVIFFRPQNKVETISVEPEPIAYVEEVVCEKAPIAKMDRMKEIFDPYQSGPDFVQTVTYHSRVPWLSGRLAFLGDYASKYRTSKHFISHSLHGDYLNEKVANGDKFKVIKEEAQIEFHLLVNLEESVLSLYAYDVEKNERMLLKNYPVSCGKRDETLVSGFLTPTGIFSLGERIAVYKEGQIRDVNGVKTEMITVFGTRWIPFDQEVAFCTGKAKGLGIHGVPWEHCGDELIEKRSCLQEYDSEGCIRLVTEDMEELFALVVSRPGFIHIVKNFDDAKLPGTEI